MSEEKSRKHYLSQIRLPLHKQTIDVDMVSGATNSSLVIKKACENAVNEIILIP